MSTFATTTSIGKILVGYLIDNTTTTDSGGADIFSAHLDRAEALVMAAVSARYDMPFTTIPPLVRSLTEDIACYNVIRAAHYQDSKQKNQYLEEFKSAFDTLKDIESGKMNLTLTDGSIVAIRSTQRILSANENYTPIFGLDDPAVWNRDADEIEDQSAARE